MNIKTATDFVEAAIKEGYENSPGILKIEWTGKMWTVGFWLRPSQFDYSAGVDGHYKLRGLCGSARDVDLQTAIEKAIIKVER